MANKSAIRFRIDGYVEVEPTDMNSVMTGAKTIDDLKKHVAEVANVTEISSRLGTIKTGAHDEPLAGPDKPFEEDKTEKVLPQAPSGRGVSDTPEAREDPADGVAGE